MSWSWGEKRLLEIWSHNVNQQKVLAGWNWRYKLNLCLRLSSVLSDTKTPFLWISLERVLSCQVCLSHLSSFILHEEEFKKNPGQIAKLILSRISHKFDKCYNYSATEYSEWQKFQKPVLNEVTSWKWEIKAMSLNGDCAFLWLGKQSMGWLFKIKSLVWFADEENVVMFLP